MLHVEHHKHVMCRGATDLVSLGSAPQYVSDEIGYCLLIYKLYVLGVQKVGIYMAKS